MKEKLQSRENGLSKLQYMYIGALLDRFNLRSAGSVEDELAVVPLRYLDPRRAARAPVQGVPCIPLLATS